MVNRTGKTGSAYSLAVKFPDGTQTVASLDAGKGTCTFTQSAPGHLVDSLKVIRMDAAFGACFGKIGLPKEGMEGCFRRAKLCYQSADMQDIPVGTLYGACALANM